MNQTMWYLNRSTGVVAVLLAVAAVVGGLLFSARATGQRRRPGWWLDLHNWLGGLALAFTCAHIVTAWLDTDAGIGVVQILVPNTAEANPWAMTWGVLAAYLMAVTVFTTWPRRLRRRRAWRVLHLGSVLATALALLHGYQSGSESDRLSFKIALVAATGIGTYALGLRIFGLRSKESGSQRAHSSD